MTAETLWQLFLDSKVSDAHLKSLGHDLYFMRPAPLGDAKIALDGLSKVFMIVPKFAYAAMNIDPGRKVLEQLAWDYDHRLPWAKVDPGTRGYLEKVAHRIEVIKKASAPPTPPTSGASKPSPSLTNTTAAPAAPSQSSKSWSYAIGAGLFFAVIAVVSKYGQSLIHSRIESHHTT